MNLDAFLSEEAEEDTGGNCTTDNSGYVRAHCMHEEVVPLVIPETLDIRDTCGIRYCGYTGITDERVDLVALLEEEVHELHEQDSRKCCDHE